MSGSAAVLTQPDVWQRVYWPERLIGVSHNVGALVIRSGVRIGLFRAVQPGRCVPRVAIPCAIITNIITVCKSDTSKQITFSGEGNDTFTYF